jgi:tripartite-type tricarboxylate transporter receptor subunit TctC
MKHLPRFWFSVFHVMLGVGFVHQSCAQSYPNRPIRVIVSGPPAGGPDIIGRMVGQKLSTAWGQPVVIENRPGGGGNIGAELAAKALPDGYTLLVATPAHTANPTLYRQINYDPVRDFAPVTQLTAGSYILVVPLALPVKTLKDVIALARSPAGIKYASAGIGAPAHLGMELLKTVAGFDALHVPYKGTAVALVDLLAGQVDVFLTTMPGGLPFIRGGRVKPVAVTGLSRSQLLPDVPTIAESGFPGFEVSGWQGLVAPAGTAKSIIAKIHDETTRMLKLPEFRDRLAAEGADPIGGTPEAFGAYLRSEMTKWAKVIKQSGARVD